MAMKRYIPQHSSITGASPSDYLMSYPGHSGLEVGCYHSAEMQSGYSTAPSLSVDWAMPVSQEEKFWSQTC